MCQSVKAAIDRAAEKLHSKRAVADAIGVKPPNLRRAETGEAGLPADAIAELAHIAEVDAKTLLAVDAIERAQRVAPEKAERLRELFAVPRAAVKGAVIALLTGVSVLWQDDASAFDGRFFARAQDAIHIVAAWVRALMGIACAPARPAR